ncbi:hypothetical protein GDO78_001758 [Eleutherodactylus coqui]|uniref:Uncharacterized protein n=1 Tax=Eleutherodactylus coqui TaxID=57060 RepID=A0A8J6KHJ2_ELECQ|nr:hypothetical protein GDO78_001758 [Eleutherodactylus coqui]
MQTLCVTEHTACIQTPTARARSLKSLVVVNKVYCKCLSSTVPRGILRKQLDSVQIVKLKTDGKHASHAFVYWVHGSKYLKV